MQVKFLLATLVLAPGMSVNAQSERMFTLASTGGSSGWGTIISIDENGSSPNTEYTFDWTYGGTPYGRIMQTTVDSALYFTCYDGGSFASCTISRYDPRNGSYTNVYDFDITNGDFPTSGLVEGPNGKLYGATTGGGTNMQGVIYEYDIATQTYQALYSFSTSSGTQGYGQPLFIGGKLYGMTLTDGANNLGSLYCFNISLPAPAMTYTHSFTLSEGSSPFGSLIDGGNGKLYGLTSAGGTNGKGTLFMFDTTTLALTVMHHFTGPEGSTPKGDLLLAGDGMMYGTTTQGGTQNLGVIFRFNPQTNTYTKLFDCTASFGSGPEGQLSEQSGKLFGTAKYGGATSEGTLFSYDVTGGTATKIFDFSYWTTGANPTGNLLPASSPLKVADVKKPNDLLRVYPNPAGSVFTVAFPGENTQKATLRIKNAVGATVMEWTENSPGANYMHRVNASDFPAGIYVVELNTDNLSATQRLIIR